MTGPVDDSREVPFNPEAYKRQLLLLKSLHCGRPVLHQGRNQFIKCMSANVTGCDIEMTVYLAGNAKGIDSSLIEIQAASQQVAEERQRV